MKYSALSLLCCPLCRSALSHSGPRPGHAIWEGYLHCAANGHRFPIRRGRPHFITPSALVGLNRKYARLYNWIARFYDSDFVIASRVRNQFWPSGEAGARREVVERLEMPAAGRVLETGIGTGGNAPYLFERAADIEVYGVDISAGMLRQCERNLAKWGRAAELFLANSEALPFRDEAFEVVFHLGAINYYTDKERAIQEMVRVAKPGTRIVIADETEAVSGLEGPLGRLGIRLFFGRQLTAEIAAFRCRDMARLAPEGMREVRFDSIWDGRGYLLEFRKP